MNNGLTPAEQFERTVKEANKRERIQKAAPEMYEALKDTLHELETGYIANDCVAADRMRLALEKRIKAIVSTIDGGK